MNLGMPLTEFVLETVLRDGLGELRADPTKLDHLFSRFQEPQFGEQYGTAKIAQIKTYIIRNQVKIVHAFSLNATVIPCISIQMMSSEETPNLQTLGNQFENGEIFKNRAVLVNPVLPTTYDLVSGKLSIADSIDLSVVTPNQIYVDASANEFPIRSGISNDLGKKFINIGSGYEPDLSGPGMIIDSIDFRLFHQEQVRLSEVIRLGVHAKNDAHLAKFLYYIVYWILKTRQKSLITRGVHLDYGSMSALDREDQFEGEHIYTRSIDMRCQTEFNYVIDEIAVASSFTVELSVPDPKPNSPGKVKL